MQIAGLPAGDMTVGTIATALLLVVVWLVRMLFNGRVVTRREADELRERAQVAERQRERWEGIALEALGVAKTTTVQAEVTHELISRLPDPSRDGEQT